MLGNYLISMKIIIVLIRAIGSEFFRENTHVMSLYQNDKPGIRTQDQTITLYSVILTNNRYLFHIKEYNFCSYSLNWVKNM